MIEQLVLWYERLRIYWMLKKIQAEIECAVCGELKVDGWKHTLDPHYTCPVCHAVSYNLNDLEHGWCGKCHQVTRRPLVDAL